MAKTYADVLTEARQTLQDSDDPQRHSDAFLIARLNWALQELGRLRPEAFWDWFDGGDIQVPEVTAGTLTEAFPVSMQFYTAIVTYLTGVTELIEDEFASDGRAITLMNSFRTQVLSL